MSNDRIAAFLGMLERGQDSALLRFSLGNELAGDNRAAEACEHLRHAVRLDPGYSAAWKLLGRTLADDGQSDAARAAYAKGIDVAQSKGDYQAAKEMQVFLKRLDKQAR